MFPVFRKAHWTLLRSMMLLRAAQMRFQFMPDAVKISRRYRAALVQLDRVRSGMMWAGVGMSFWGLAARSRVMLHAAAERGSTKAAVNLGLMDTAGDGGPRDYKKAIEWFLFAAKRGDDSAKNNIGVMYLNALGVRRNFILAHALFNMAAAHGATIAIENRNFVARAMTASQIAKAQQMASKMDMQENFPETSPPSKNSQEK